MYRWGACVGQALPAVESGHCTDTVDNDCNGLIDCADPACVTASTCCVANPSPADGTIWANSPDTLYRVDPATFAVAPGVIWPRAGTVLEAAL